ncbi:hypothetical protein IKG68_00950 [Candidatus Saccharibacteria bacterium]|nr:hypothetical protein [Candidatus Saccharibacteria bacterium]
MNKNREDAHLEDNLTLEQEEEVHENSYIEFLPGHPIIQKIIFICSVVALFSLPAIANLT